MVCCVPSLFRFLHEQCAVALASYCSQTCSIRVLAVMCSSIFPRCRRCPSFAAAFSHLRSASCRYHATEQRRADARWWQSPDVSAHGMVRRRLHPYVVAVNALVSQYIIPLVACPGLWITSQLAQPGDVAGAMKAGRDCLVSCHSDILGQCSMVAR